jgi:protein-glutamine gamma-glutamyltransferase
MFPVKPTWSSLERSLSLHVAAMTMLAAVILGLRHETSWLPAVVALTPLVTVFVTDAWKVVRLNRWVANTITVGAVAWTLRNFLEISSEEKLMAIGTMLCYLQIVLLFQEKTIRIYWHLVVLGVLEVVVAAALDLGPHFVLLVGLFLTVGLSTLVLLGVYREVKSDGRQTWSVTEGAALFMKQNAPSRGWLQPRGQIVARSAKLLLAAPRVENTTGDEPSLSRLFPLPLLLRQTVLLTAVTIIFTTAFFYATPRLRDFSPDGVFGEAVSGFRPEVQLLRKTRIHLSGRAVMRVVLSRMSDRKPVELIGEPYFHGVWLTDYQVDDTGSRWLPPQMARGSGGGGRWLLRAVPQTSKTQVRQDIVVESNVNRPFAIMPIHPIYDAPATYGGSSRGNPERPQQHRYSWATPAIMNDRQVKAIPNPNRRRTDEEKHAFAEEIQRAKKYPEERFPRLTEIAAEVIEQNELAQGRSFNKAEALERHFLAAGQYQYSLNVNLAEDEQIDPIEDFVANKRAGNCEYFASALTMMLRSQGIPARLVRGYKGGTFNSVGRYYLVQERDAHSWVEAWMPNEEIPASEMAGVASEGGAWYRFDPTPGSNNQVTLTTPGWGERTAQAFDYVELLWRDYVLSMNTSRQDEIVYEPLTARVGSLPPWVEFRGVSRWLRNAGAALGFESLSRSGRGARAFETSLAVAVILTLVSLAAVAYALRWLWIRAWRWMGSRRAEQANRSPPFYRKLERLLAQLPLVRKQGETPREMAREAGVKIGLTPGHAKAAILPGKLVAAYYRVRFGNDRLDKVETEAIEQALTEIDAAVKQSRRH